MESRLTLLRLKQENSFFIPNPEQEKYLCFFLSV